MFRQEEIYVGGWQEKTMEAMQRRRFEQQVSQLPPLGTHHLEALPPAAFERRLERCWQDIERKPMRMQQMSEVWRGVLSSIERQADCLSHEEHALVERALILGGSAQIEDALELEAACALELRLWASVGLVSGRPVIELERPVLQPVAKAFARAEHEHTRKKLSALTARLTGALYRAGALDDRQPQQMILRDVFGGKEKDEMLMQLARRYLWASFDCVDYTDGVMLVHPALADPGVLLARGRRRACGLILPPSECCLPEVDILPEEIPLERGLECAIQGALRSGYSEQDTARNLRFLCKQGAPLRAMEEILQSSLIVCLSGPMKRALENMYYSLPKWMECAELAALQ